MVRWHFSFSSQLLDTMQILLWDGYRKIPKPLFQLLEIYYYFFLSRSKPWIKTNKNLMLDLGCMVWWVWKRFNIKISKLFLGPGIEFLCPWQHTVPFNTPYSFPRVLMNGFDPTAGMIIALSTSSFPKTYLHHVYLMSRSLQFCWFHKSLRRLHKILNNNILK